MGHATKTIDAKPLRDLVKLHGLTIPEIAKRTELSTSALYGWDRAGRMPAYMGPVCVGLLAQIKGEAPGMDPGTTLIVKLPAGQSDTATRLLDAIGAKYRVVDDI